PEIYTLSLHDALPILAQEASQDDLVALDRLGNDGVNGLILDIRGDAERPEQTAGQPEQDGHHEVNDPDVVAYLVLGLVGDEPAGDRKSTRLNSSHVAI